VSIAGEITVKMFVAVAAFLTVLGLVLSAGGRAATAGPKQGASSSYGCYTGERKRSCSAPYKRKRDDGNPFECVADDDDGRKRACTVRLKRN
jgi:hypothetical protein